MGARPRAIKNAAPAGVPGKAGAGHGVRPWKAQPVTGHTEPEPGTSGATIWPLAR
jgi:hypothetical protein